MNAKLDIKTLHRTAYAPGRKPATVDIPELLFLMIDGAGDPNIAPAYREAVEALFATAYTVKFAAKKAGSPDFAVMPLEGLWWAEDMATFLTGDKSRWQWTMMIAVPDFVTPAAVTDAAAKAAAKKDLPAAGRIRLERFAEGPSVQVLHVGPYDSEGPVIAAMHAFAAEQGYALRGRHHEIYLSDARRTEPAKLKTILRQPVTIAR